MGHGKRYNSTSTFCLPPLPSSICYFPSSIFCRPLAGASRDMSRVVTGLVTGRTSKSINVQAPCHAVTTPDLQEGGCASPSLNRNLDRNLNRSFPTPNLSPLFAPFRPYSPQKNMEPSKNCLPWSLFPHHLPDLLELSGPIRTQPHRTEPNRTYPNHDSFRSSPCDGLRLNSTNCN